jgi:hypothetical protein
MSFKGLRKLFGGWLPVFEIVRALSGVGPLILLLPHYCFSRRHYVVLWSIEAVLRQFSLVRRELIEINYSRGKNKLISRQLFLTI